MKYKETKDYLLINDKMQNMFDYIEKESVEAIITDPPYELGFMGKSWDSSGVAFKIDTWQKCYDALKSGGYLLAFGGSRTYHRIACAIEDAGFEIRDCIMWLYGSGFPKSQNISKILDKKLGEERPIIGYTNNAGIAKNAKPDSTGSHIWSGILRSEEAISVLAKQWNGWGTCLKPAYEPIIVARKPFKGSLVDNVIEYGVGGLNIDECRVGSNGEMILQNTNVQLDENKSNPKEYRQKKMLTELKEIGRFPANVILTYDETDKDEVCGGFPISNKPNGNIKNPNLKNSLGKNGIYNKYSDEQPLWDAYQDTGSASRYFYCAKASKKDRDEGLEQFDSLKVNDGRQTPIDNPFQRGESLRKNIHPTVKPVELMQYLVRLVAPKGSTIMDCFMGSGSTGKAVMFENREREANYKFIGIEMTDEYLPICESRIEYALNKYEYDAEIENKKDHEEGRLNIFDFIEEDVE